MLPTICRIVRYRDIVSGEHWSAIITAVEPTGVIDLTVFPPKRLPDFRVAVSFGDGPGQWSWPPRVETQS